MDSLVERARLAAEAKRAAEEAAAAERTAQRHAQELEHLRVTLLRFGVVVDLAKVGRDWQCPSYLHEGFVFEAPAHNGTALVVGVPCMDEEPCPRMGRFRPNQGMVAQRAVYTATDLIELDKAFRSLAAQNHEMFPRYCNEHQRRPE
jgi:hypothetical protein